MVERLLRLPFDRPVRQLREFLDVLNPLVRGEPACTGGELVSADWTLTIPPLPRVPVLVGALGSQTLKVAGRHADGTITWMTGPTTLSEHTVPTLRAASRAAGRPEPRVVVALPVWMTDDPGAAREHLAGHFGFYDRLPSYRAMIEREGAAGPADLAIVGDEAELRDRLERLAAAGATDFAAQVAAVDERDRGRTLDALRGLL